MTTLRFNFCNQNQHDASKTLTIANQFGDPIKQYLSVTCFSSFETKLYDSMIPSVEADINFINLGSPFSENYSQYIHIPDSTMHFKHFFTDQPTTAYFTAMIEKKFPFLCIDLTDQFKKANFFWTQNCTIFTLSTEEFDFFLPITEKY